MSAVIVKGLLVFHIYTTSSRIPMCYRQFFSLNRFETVPVLLCYPFLDWLWEDLFYGNWL